MPDETPVEMCVWCEQETVPGTMGKKHVGDPDRSVDQCRRERLQARENDEEESEADLAIVEQVAAALDPSQWRICGACQGKFYGGFRDDTLCALCREAVDSGEPRWHM